MNNSTNSISELQRLHNLLSSHINELDRILKKTSGGKTPSKRKHKVLHSISKVGSNKILAELGNGFGVSSKELGVFTSALRSFSSLTHSPRSSRGQILSDLISVINMATKRNF